MYELRSSSHGGPWLMAVETVVLEFMSNLILLAGEVLN